MINADAFLKEISQPRTVEQMECYYNKIKATVKADRQLIELARLKKGLFKEFYEEYLPLLKFAKSDFGFKDALYNIVIGNQNYDGIINVDNAEIKVEITMYHDGKKSYSNAKELNDDGYNVIVSDLEEDVSKFITNFIQNLMKKKQRNYQGAILLIVIPTDEIYFIFRNYNFQNIANRIVSEIVQAQFDQNDIYLLFENIDENYSKDHIYKIK